MVTSVFIILSGDFKVLKKIPKDKPSLEQNTDNIFKDPLKAKRQISEFDVKNLSKKFDVCILESAYRSQFVGVEDVVNLNLRYTVSVLCESLSGTAIFINKTDFLRLKSYEQVWSIIRNQVSSKVDKFCHKIVSNSEAEG